MSSQSAAEAKKNVSVNLIKAIDHGRSKKSKILGIVGKTNGYLALKGDCVIKIPFINQKFLTPFSEAMQGVIWHYLVSHPRLQVKKTK